MESGATHRKGFTAISWEIWLVVASSRIEPHADSPSQNSAVHNVGRAAGAASTSAGATGGAEGRRRHAVHAHSATKAAYNADQIDTCVRRRKNGSRANG